MSLQAMKTQGGNLLRTLIYGPPKARKTWWAVGGAAEAGFNVIHLDNEKSAAVLLNNLTPAAIARVQRVDIEDTTQAVCAEFLARTLKGDTRRPNPFVWDNRRKCHVLMMTQVVPENSHTLVDFSKLGPNDVVVLDTWTRVVDSVMLRFALENNIDPEDATKLEREGYRWSGTLASWLMDRLVTLPCHVIVIGHAVEYEKRSPDGKTVIWSRTQVRSTSGPHARTLGGKFSDILYFTPLTSMKIEIDARPDKARDGGSRVLPPKAYTWDNKPVTEAELSFPVYCDLAGISLPPRDLAPTAAIRYIADGNELTQDDFGAMARKMPASPLAPPAPLGNTGTAVIATGLPASGNASLMAALLAKKPAT